MEDWTRWFDNLQNTDIRDVKQVASHAKLAERALDDLSGMDEESFDPGDIKGIISDVQQALASDSEHIGDASVKLDKAIEYARYLEDRLTRMLGAYKALGVVDDEERNVESIAQWCEENMHEGWFWMHLTEDKTKAVFLFDKESEAVHFKMRWG